MKKSELLKTFRIDKLGETTVFIQNKHVRFSYTNADSVVKDEYKGKYTYLGGLQCDYDPNSVEYKNIELILIELAKKVLNEI